MTEMMKDSKVEYIGLIPENWSITRYKYHTCSGMGNTITKDMLEDEGIPVYSATKDDSVFGYLKSPTLKLNKGDMVVGARGTIGFPKLMEDVSTCTQTTIWTKFDSSVDNRYVYYCFLAFQDDWNPNEGSGVPQLTVDNLNEGRFPQVCLDEQKLIADFLDEKCAEIDQLFEDIQKQIDILEEYKKSVITRAVTKGLHPNAEMKDSGIKWIGNIPKSWEVLRIKNLGSARNGLTYSPNDLTDEENGTLVLRSSNVQDGKISLNNNVYVSCRIPNNLMVKKGDILICSRNGSRELIGKNAIINDIQATYGAFMMVYRNIDSEFLYYVLNSEVFSYYLGTFFTSTINQLTGQNFNNMKIVFCPDKSERQKIVDYLKNKIADIDNSIEIKREQLENLNTYKKSIIYEYVTGKRRVA